MHQNNTYQGNDNGSVNKSRSAMLSVHSCVHSWGGCDENEAGSSNPLPKQCLMDCLRQFMASSLHLRRADIQGEFAAFHWQCSDLSLAGWTLSGKLEGYSSLQVYHDPVKQEDFVELVC